jgi:deferrochelatase/peroxidase EfeB
MDAGPVAPRQRRPSWKLASGIAQATQGLVVTGFGSLPTGRALFLTFGAEERWSGGGAWLSTLDAIAPVSPAVPPDKASRRVPAPSVALALTWSGLQRMGLPETALASFSRPFREGMMQTDRLRRLGDRRGGKWLPTVLDGGPLWSANVSAPAPTPEPVAAYDVPRAREDEQVRTPVTVHALLLLYTPDEAAADALERAIETGLKPHGIGIAMRRELRLDVENGGVSREFFGFADGLSQPAPFDENKAVTLDGDAVTQPHPVQGVPLGEFLIGYMNGHHEKAPGPVVPEDADGANRPQRAGLEPRVDAQGFYDLGLNGSYMVVRELEQDVPAFWQNMDENAAAMRAQDPAHSAHVTADWLAERIVGRDRDGHLLCPAGRLKPGPDGMPDSDFLFHAADPHGLGCPLGSHVRRANPRDALAPSEKERASLLNATNNHRILRRGRKFGSTAANARTHDGQKRGLLFICLNTDIARQFEFVQQNWMLNSDFATLFGETDPLVGPDGPMTISEKPLRRTVHVRTFVRMAGGDYFFLPSLPALRYLALL